MVIVLFVSDTPESRGLPSIQKISGEAVRQTDKMPTRELQKMVVRHPGIWVIAVSSIFVYIAQYGISNWGTLFLQKAKGFSIESAGSIIGLSEAAGVAGTVLAGWLSDTVFKGNRIRPVLISGFICLGALAVFLFGEGGYLANLAYLAVFSLSIAVLYCIVAGLMALDIVPRKATGAALGIVGLSSYTFAAFQDLISGFLIQGHTVSASGAPIAEATYNFAPVSFFWLAACFLAFLVPVCSWRLLKK
jgi:OPA family sugar phosphate sensor protein UhpC-like MFS transporter